MPQIWKAEFIISSDDIGKIEHQLWDQFENLSLYRLEDDETKHNVEITYEGDQNASDLEEKLRAVCGNENVPVPSVSYEELPDIDWLEHVYQKYPPVEAGRFYVHGSHVTEYPEGVIPITLNAATAFGTGEHGTTKGCLMAFDELAQSQDFNKILDMGCGAGVLAIAAAKVLKKKVVAIDNLAEAVRVALENAQMNDVGDYVIAECGDGFKTPMALKNGPYDLIFANILAGALIDMAEDFKRNCAKGGLIILSGILQTQQDWVLSTYEDFGFSLVKKFPIDEWQTMIVRKDA